MDVPVQLSQASGVPYYRQIVDQVAQLVRSGRLPPATRLPSVRDLASQLLVSLITIRRAYADLEAAGLIVRRQGHGTFVAEEVEMASRDQVLTETRQLLSGVVDQAHRFGLRNHDIRALLDSVLREGEAADGTD
jgi:GntR family transcriptional regulator